MNRDKPGNNWWSFSIDERERGEKISGDEAAGTVEVNPVTGGRRLLSYHQYLGLEGLLNCQVPSSRAPEERVFIITHQLFELVFKQMIFDFLVIAETFRSLLARGDADFRRLLDLPAGGNPVAAAAGFWRPALTAAARIRHGAGNVLPWLMAYLAQEETFSNEEFTQKFRDNLLPASGFQSAQFRLIQRALGKSCLLDVRLFPADTYLKAYEGKSDAEVRQISLTAGNAGLVTLVDPLILREGLAVATPPAGSELSLVAGLDDLAHQTLARVAVLDESGDEEGEECRVALLPSRDDKGAAMAEKFAQRLQEAVKKKKSDEQQPAVLTGDELKMIARRGGVFRQDWLRAVARESRRREQHRTACRGAALLLRDKREGPLASILARLAAADRDLYGKFLLFHQNAVARRIGEVPGTAGGGVPYLDFSRELIGHFPALAHFRERYEIPPQGV